MCDFNIVNKNFRGLKTVIDSIIKALELIAYVPKAHPKNVNQKTVNFQYSEV